MENTSVCVSWKKPCGGQKIANYLVEWKKQKNDAIAELNSTQHESDIESYDYVINDLDPGERVNVTIRANNSAGESKPVFFSYASCKFVLE